MDEVLEINELIRTYKKANIISSKDISDTHHTFGELYKQRMIMFCTICNFFPNLS